MERKTWYCTECGNEFQEEGEETSFDEPPCPECKQTDTVVEVIQEK